jgi:hypothetical protein
VMVELFLKNDNVCERTLSNSLYYDSYVACAFLFA